MDIGISLRSIGATIVGPSIVEGDDIIVDPSPKLTPFKPLGIDTCDSHHITTNRNLHVPA